MYDADGEGADDMFDRCDAETTLILDSGLAEARRLGHQWLGTEHLLLGLVQHPERLPRPVAARLPSVESLRSALDAAISPPSLPDAELLATLGIDLDEVRTIVDQTFGTDAVDRLSRRRVHRGWQRWRRPSRWCTSLLAGNMSVAPRTKQALEQATHDAARRGRSLIDPAGLMLGIVTVEDSLANKLLRSLGVEPEDLRAALHGNGA